MVRLDILENICYGIYRMNERACVCESILKNVFKKGYVDVTKREEKRNDSRIKTNKWSQILLWKSNRENRLGRDSNLVQLWDTHHEKESGRELNPFMGFVESHNGLPH